MTSDQSLLDSDREARAAALDVTRSFVVQAPAGSGKTELLIQRYLKLLSIVGDPEEVLAITFTRKAAAEMQQRVLEALRSAAHGEDPVEEHRQLTSALAVAVLQRDRENNWQLLLNPRRMRIQTLDSLNAALARARPLSSPSSASGARIVVDAELESLHRAAALATLDWLAEPGAIQEATREVLTHVDNNTRVYVEYVAQMLSTRDQWLPFVGTGLLALEDARALRARLEADLAATVVDHLRKTAAAIDAAAAASLCELAGYAGRQLRENAAPDHPIAALADLTTLPAAGADDIDRWTGLAELLLTKQGAFRSRVDKRQGFPPGDAGQKAAMFDLLASLRERDGLRELLHRSRDLPPVRYTDEQWGVLLALFRLLPLAATELARLFAEQGVADHIEIALTAASTLGTAENPGDVALLLDYRVSHILVDEMQDTSTAQYRMLEALTGGWTPGDARTLFCVGDPMQSIYRFRNAEVGQFLLARRAGIASVPMESLTLRRNFRSGSVLVDWFNAVFPSILAKSDDPANGAVSYSEAVSVPQQAGVGACRVHPLLGGGLEDEAALGCRVIAETLSRNPDDDMAVLVRSRTQLPYLLAALRRQGIDYRAVEIDRLTDLPEIIEVLALTRAAVHAGDRLAWLALLRAPWIGLDWSDLLALVQNDRSSTVWELLQCDGRLSALSAAGRHAIEKALPVLRLLVMPRRSQGLRSLVEQCWLTLGGPAILEDDFAVSNVYRFLDALDRHERCGSLDDVATLEGLLDLERVSSDKPARLQVMTMHRAKGLEFEHVLLYGLGRAPRGRDTRVLSWYDVPLAHGDERKLISPVGPRAILERDPVHRYIELGETRKDRHETARLLYVACTRARKTLHLIGHTNRNQDTLRPPDSRSLLRLLWPAVEPHYRAALPAGEEAADAMQAPIWVDPVLRRIRPEWELPEFDGLPGPAAPDDASEEKVEFYWVGTEARLAGTIVHRWMHLLAEARAEDLRADPSRHINVTARWLDETGVSDSMADSISARVGKALESVLSDDRGRWLLEGEGYAELGLSGLYEGRLESVVLDRVRIDDSGIHWIVDYKTSTHEGGNLEGFLKAEADRYRAQLDKYAAIYEAFAGTRARRALYFPLLQTFLEV